MAHRVTDEMVLSWLGWARNYGEIVSFERVADSGAKWLISLPAGIKKSRYDIDMPLPDHSRYVPVQLTLTSREALVFAFGCAAGGAKERARWTQDDWKARQDAGGRYERGQGLSYDIEVEPVVDRIPPAV